ncbi:hypothetical protein EMCRGX_G000976 [Ephydatia muelleri]
MNPSCQRWTTFATSSGIYIRGAPLISSPPEGSIKEKASEMPEDLSHLKKTVIYDYCYVLPIVCIPSKKSCGRVSGLGHLNECHWLKCMIPFSVLVEIAFFKSTTASISSLGLTQFTRISANNRSIRFDAGLIRDESKGPSSEQQGQFSAPVAATHSTMHMVHTSALHGSSSGCVRRLEHS